MFESLTNLVLNYNSHDQEYHQYQDTEYSFQTEELESQDHNHDVPKGHRLHPRLHSVHNPFELARGVTVGLYDHIFVADAGSKRVVLLDNKGSVKRKIRLPKGNAPQDLATTSSGEIAIVDGSELVRFYDIDGTLINTIDIAKHDKNKTVNCKCIAIDARDDIIVGDQSQRTIIRYTRTGTFMKEFKIQVNDTTIKPSFLAVNKWRQVVIGNVRKSGLYVFDYFGRYQFTVNTIIGKRMGKPYGVYINQHNDIFAALHFNGSNEIHRFRRTGTHFGCVVQELKFPFGISMSKDDNMMIIADKTLIRQYFKSRSKEWDMCPSTKLSFRHFKSWQGHHFDFAHGVTVNHDDQVAVVDVDRARVTLHDEDGKYILTFGDSLLDPESQLYKPTAVHRSFNNFVVADNSQFIRLYEPSGQYLGRFAVRVHLYNPRRVNLVKDGKEHHLHVGRHDISSVAIDENDRYLIISDLQHKMISIQSITTEKVETFPVRVSPSFISLHGSSIIITGHKERTIQVMNYFGHIATSFTINDTNLQPTCAVSDGMGGFYVGTFSGLPGRHFSAISGMGGLNWYSGTGKLLQTISTELVNPRGLWRDRNKLYVADKDSIEVFLIEYA